MLSVRLICNSLMVVAGLSTVAGGCASSAESPRQQEKTGAVSSEVFGGSPGTTHPEVGFMSIQRGVAGTLQPQAVLIAPSLIVTSVLSVVKGFTYGTGVSFDSSGAICATCSAVSDTSEMVFTLGDGATTPDDYLTGKVGTTRNITQIITNGETDSCKGGLAFAVLDKPIDGVNIPQLRLDNVPNVNESVTACGWGQVDTKCTFPTTLLCGTGSVTISNGGYFADDQDTFQPGFVLTTVNTCGDRGGAIYDSNGAIFAVVDKYIQPDKSKKPTFSDPCLDCSGAVTDGILLAQYPDLVARAFAAVGSSPWRTGHQKPADVGGTCTDALDCNSQLCVGVGATNYCSQDCSSAACPASTVCTTSGGRSVCLPQVNPHPASCSAAPNATSSDSPQGFGLVLAFAGLAGLARQRRRASRRPS